VGRRKGVLTSIIHGHAGEYFANHISPIGKEALPDRPSVLKAITVNDAKKPNPKPLVAEQFADEV
jgi:hypothetical protein